MLNLHLALKHGLYVNLTLIVRTRNFFVIYVGTLGCDDKCVFADPCHNLFCQNIAMTDIPNFKVRQQYRSGELFVMNLPIVLRIFVCTIGTAAHAG